MIVVYLFSALFNNNLIVSIFNLNLNINIMFIFFQTKKIVQHGTIKKKNFLNFVVLLLQTGMNARDDHKQKKKLFHFKIDMISF